MAEVYLRDKNGQVYAFDEKDSEAAQAAGLTLLTPEEAQQTRLGEAVGRPGADVGGLSTEERRKAYAAGAAQPKGGFDEGLALREKFGNALVMGGLWRDVSPEEQFRAKQLSEQSPWLSAGVEAAGMLPLSVLGGVGAAGAAARMGGSLAARAGAGAGLALFEGAQAEAEIDRTEGEEFNPTRAAIVGFGGALVGAGAAWTLAKAAGVTRNLVNSATRQATEDMTDRVFRGGLVDDYRIAQWAPELEADVARRAAAAFDAIEENFNKVAALGKKQGRIAQLVDSAAMRPEVAAAQADARLVAINDLRALREAIVAAEPSPTGQTTRFLGEVDHAIATLSGEAPPKGGQLWKTLDDHRRALQGAIGELEQAYADDATSAWLSREGLEQLHQTEKRVREGLLRPEVWGERAAKEQAAYNRPFHEKFFPAQKVVRQRFLFGQDRNFKGFVNYRGEQAKILRNLVRPAKGDLDSYNQRQLLTQWLEGVEEIAKVGFDEDRAAAQAVLDAVKVLRRAPEVGQIISSAAERHATRAGTAELAVGALAGAAAWGPMGAVVGPALRGARVGEWLGKAARRLGLFRGARPDVEKLFPANAPYEPPTANIADDILEQPLRPDPPPAAPAAAAARRPDHPPAAPAAPARRPPAAPPSPIEELAMRAMGVRPGASPDEINEAFAGMAPGARDIAERLEREDALLGGNLDEDFEARPPLSARPTEPAPARRPREAITGAQFREVVGQLQASGDAQAAEIAETLAKHEDDLRAEGLIDDEVGLLDDGWDAGPQTQPVEGPPSWAGGAAPPSVFPEAATQPPPAPPGPDAAERIMAQKIGDAQGSNEGGWYRGSDGVDRYVKIAKDPSQAYTEALANRLYQDAGFFAPSAEVFTTPDGRVGYATVKLDPLAWRTAKPSSHIVGDSLGNGLGVDMVLANWDVVGATFDNVLVNADLHAVMRLDNGGSLLFRAMGERKTLEQLSAVDWGFFDNEQIAKALRSGIPLDKWKAMKQTGLEDKEALIRFYKPHIRANAEKLVQIRDFHGGWQAYVRRHAPDMAEDDVVTTALALDERLGRVLDMTSDVEAATPLLGALFPENAIVPRTQLLDELPEAPPGLEDEFLKEGMPILAQLNDQVKQVADTLTQDEREALHFWTTFGSTELKAAQRAAATPDKVPMLGPLDTAMARLAIDNPTDFGPLGRYIYASPAVLSELALNDVFRTGSVISTGYVPDKSFGDVLMIFRKVDRGSPLLDALGLPPEHEVLLDKGLTFKKVAQYKTAGDVPVFVFEQIPDSGIEAISPLWRAAGALGVPLGLGAAAAGEGEEDGAAGAAAGGLAALAGRRAMAKRAGEWARKTTLFRQYQDRLVQSTVRALVAGARATPGAAARQAARAAISRAELAERQKQLAQWTSDPEELLQRIDEGLADMPGDAVGATALGSMRALSYLRERLPKAMRINAAAVRDVPVSEASLRTFALYERAALRPADALKAAQAEGRIAPETLETFETLYPDLLLELRVAAAQEVQAMGVPPSMQGRLVYAQLMGQSGAIGDPAFAPAVTAALAAAVEELAAQNAGSAGSLKATAPVAPEAPAGLAKIGRA